MWFQPLFSSRTSLRSTPFTGALAVACPLLAMLSAAHAGDVEVRPDFTVRASDPQPYDAFGYGLAADGNALLVGSRGSDSTALNGGAIYAFAWSGAAWQQVQKLVFPTAAAGDQIGESLAMRGSVGVAGAPGRGNGGAAFILRFDGGAWFPLTEVNDSSAGVGAAFGTSVAAGADAIAIGAPASTEGVGANAGRVRIFRRAGSAWNSAEFLKAPFPDPGDRFGFAVALDGAWLAVAAPGDDDAGVNAGAVYLFRDAEGTYQLAAKILPPGSGAQNAEAGFGQSICLANSKLLVGAPRSDIAGTDAGAVFRFALSPKGGAADGVLAPPAGTGPCEYGFSIAALGDAVVVGAPGLPRDGGIVGGAFVYLDGTDLDGVLTSPIASMGLVGTRVAVTAASIVASGPALSIASANYAGELVAIDRTLDCNTSGTPDAIEIANGTLVDGNEDGVPDACQCLPDLSGDGVVSAADLALILGFWGTDGSGVIDADLDDDGVVSASDLALVLGNWGPCPN